MTALIRFRWRYFDPIRRRTVTTSYWETEDIFHAKYPDAVPVEGSRQELQLSNDPLDNCMSRLQGAAPRK